MNTSTLYDQLGLDPNDSTADDTIEPERSTSTTCTTHALSIYSDQETQFEAVIPFIRRGLERDERCVYLTSGTDATTLKTILRNDGIDVGAAAARRELDVVDAETFYLDQGTVDVEAVLGRLKELLAEVAADSDCAGLRVISETLWIPEYGISPDHIATYEARINDIETDVDHGVLCQYDRTVIPDHLLLDLIRTHPILIYEGTPTQNPLYESPAEFLNSKSDTIDIDRIGQMLVAEDQRRRELEETKERYRGLVNHFPNGAVGLFDEDLRFTATGGELLGDLLCEDPHWKRLPDHYPPEIVAEIEPHFQAALDGESGEFEIEFAGRFFLGRTVPVPGVYNHQFAGMVVILDVTDQRAHERHLEEFVSAVSHDLREPLSTVANYLQLLERRYEDNLDKDAQQFVEFAVSGATRMREMIDGLVAAYAQIDAAGDPLEPVDLNSVLDDVRVDLESKIEETDAEITHELLPKVHGDRGQLRQVLMNLVDNALKYSGDSPPRIHVETERAEDTWITSVHDEGIGIDPDAADDIFDVFHRLHSHDDYPGTGIGLALCERIVERQGGNIWVESVPGEGSTFSFSLPIVRDHEMKSE